MNKKPSISIQQNYSEIAELCRETEEPVYLTNNGEVDMVVMDIVSFHKKEKTLELREELLAVEEDRMNGINGYLAEDVVEMMKNAIKESSNKESGQNI